MKRFTIISATLAVLLVLGLAFAACDTGTTGGSSGEKVPVSNLAEKLAWLTANAESEGSYIVELNADEKPPPRPFLTATRPISPSPW